MINVFNSYSAPQNIKISGGKNISFCGCSGLEQLGKDVFVGVRKGLIQETAFFREPETLEFIKDYVLKNLKSKDTINILDGACSKGYETYSLAMLFDKSGKKINITGFDLGRDAIKEANEGKFVIKMPIDDDDRFAIGYHTTMCDDMFLAFKNPDELSPKELEYKKLFDEYFRETSFIPKKLSLKQRIYNFIYKMGIPEYKNKSFEIKPEKAELCKFIQGDILKLSEIAEPQSVDALLFRNALYHLTTMETYERKVPLHDDMIIPAVKEIVNQADYALAPNGLFCIGIHENDHKLTTGKTLYSSLKEHNFEPVFIENGLPSVWKKL